MSEHVENDLDKLRGIGPKYREILEDIPEPDRRTLGKTADFLMWPKCCHHAPLQGSSANDACRAAVMSWLTVVPAMSCAVGPTPVGGPGGSGRRIVTSDTGTVVLLERALDQTAAIIAAIPGRQAGLATPCPD